MEPSFLKSVQTMRFFAALGVVQYHLWWNYFGIGFAHPGTDFFLVLVGAIAAYRHSHQIAGGNWWKYISGRYKRLYVTFIPLFIITLLAKLDEASLGWAVRSFFFIPTRDRFPVIGATWMISMFLLFYFIFSISFLMRTEKILWFLFAVWIISIVAYNFFGWNPALPKEWSGLFFRDRNIEFIIGYLAGFVLRSDRLNSIQAKTCIWVGLAGIIAGTIMLNRGLPVIWRIPAVGIPTALFILGLATLELQKVDGSIVKLLTHAWLVWLGGTSYVLYLSHSMFFQLWSRILPVARIWFVPMTLGAIAAAAFGYIFLEKPALAFLRNRKQLATELSGRAGTG